MLRSTSVKNDQWKPVKLIARHSIEGSVIDSSSSFSGNLVVVLTDSNINIFNNRELVETIDFPGGKKVIITDDANNIVVLSSKSLTCYTNWGKVKWEITEISETTILADGNVEEEIILSLENNLKIVNRFGDTKTNIALDSEIISLSKSHNIIAALTKNSINIIDQNNDVTRIETNDFSSVYCSKDSIIALSNEQMVSFSHSGSKLWYKDYSITNMNFSNEGIKHIFVLDSNNLCCQDRNGDKLWDYTSREDFDKILAIESGEMVGVSSNKAFHVIDVNGKQAWSYQAREKIVNFTFANYGGDIIIVSESKVHWFQNEGFLRIQIQAVIDNAENLLEKISLHESYVDNLRHDIDQSKSLQSGNFDLIKQSFNLINETYTRLSVLKQRHVGYLDALPSFMDTLGLQGAQTDDMLPLLYPYYSFYSDLKDFSIIDSSLQRSENLVTKLSNHVNVESDNLGSDKSANFLKDAKEGILSEIESLKSLYGNIEKDIKSLEGNVKKLILQWLKTGDLSSDPKTFLLDYKKSSEIRISKIKLINDMIDNHMAFIDYTKDQDVVSLSSKDFSSSDEVFLNLEIKNKSKQKLENIILRIKVEGQGISLLDPPSGVFRLDHLKAGELFTPSFSFTPLNRSLTKVAMVLQYDDDLSRSHTIWLGESESNFLGCHVKPVEISSEKHDFLRLKYKDSTSHSVLNIEGLSIKKVVNLASEIPGLHLCDNRFEDTRSIMYHSAQSTLDESMYLSMIFLRVVGNEESLKTALELICHSSDIDKSTEVKEELLSYLKKNLLASNGRLV